MCAFRWFYCLALLLTAPCWSAIQLGIDRLIHEESQLNRIKGRRIGLIANHTSFNSDFCSSYALLKEQCHVVALFAPEHGLTGSAYADEKLLKHAPKDSIPVYSLFGETRRPTSAMLQGIEVLVYDIQDIGSRSYTYATTLFYIMEEAAKHKIPVIVCDRPNPLGNIVDGPLLQPQWRSFLGYLSVPYCHGMTIGELAQLFNSEYQVGCLLHVVPMQGWKHTMSYQETGLPWVPLSPQIPEADTPFYYPMTGILGELHSVNIGVGYTLPFKVVAAPWIDGEKFAAALNRQHFPGVHFHPIHYRPFFGSFKGKECSGVRIVITDEKKVLPVSTQYLLLGVLKTLYPQQFHASLEQIQHKNALFCQLTGSQQIVDLICNEKYVAYSLRKICDEARAAFAPTREKYLLQEYR
jgi:uncharacterized protein YbbC (DUF1343 family)